MSKLLTYVVSTYKMYSYQGRLYIKVKAQICPDSAV